MSNTSAPRQTQFRVFGAILALSLYAVPGWGATLVGYWNLNEGAGNTAADSSGSGNTGTLINAPAWIAGESGKALNFPNGGKAYVAASGAGSLANLYTGGLTVAAWINPRSGGGGSGGRLIDKDNNDGGWFLAMNGSTGLRFAVDAFPTVSPSRLSTTAIKVNGWQHVAATWDGSVSGSNIHIYINGVLADGTPSDGAGVASPDADTPFAIGNRSVDLARSFDGAIDEVRVYRGVLSAAEIQALANGQTPPPPDTQPPTVPTGFKSTSITATSIAIAWTASTDLPSTGGTGVAGYFVYRNGNTTTPIATAKGSTSLTDSGLTSATTYTYQVAAFDAATPANVSAPTAALTVMTQAAAPLSGGDIGGVSTAGSSSSSGGTYTLKGSGVDIWGTADSFQFDSQTFTGDGTITARVVSQTNTNVWAKAGVMFRETLAAGSSFAGIFIAVANPSLIEARAGTGASAVSTKGAQVKAPYWVRLTRAGNLFSGSISANGTSWTSVGTYTVPMSAQVRIGLADTSHANGSLSTAVFDNVSITSTGGAPPSVDVTTYKYDLARTGLNAHETVLTTANVRSATFGLLRTLPGDGTMFAEPLYLSALTVGGASHNVVFVATEHNSVYAYDADTGAKLWQKSLNGTGETTSDDRSCSGISPEIGVTATPVIDRGAGPHGAIYVVAMSRDSSGGYHQRIHALDVTTGGELFNGPTEISATYPTAVGGSTTFDPGAYEDRAGLLLLNGEIYTTWASHCDNVPYSGWIIAYSGSTLARTRILNIGPNSNNLGPSIWQSGGAPAADSGGYIYVLAGNGIFEPTLDANGFPNEQDYGNSYVKISTAGNTLAVADYFAMWNEVDESNQDLDLGAGAPMLLPDLTDINGTVQHLGFSAGKDGFIYIVSRDSLGKFNAAKNNIWQQIDQGGQAVRSTPAYFNGRIYLSALNVGLEAFTITNAKLSASPTSQTTNAFGYPGTVPVVSSNGTTNGIVWATTVANPSVLYAYDATNLGTMLYNSSQAANGRDSFGTANLFNSPTVVAGKVFVPTRTGVAVFGLR